MSSVAPPPNPAGRPPAGPHPVPDVAAYLSGVWTVERELYDLSAGTSGRFHGTAVFRREDEGGEGGASGGGPAEAPAGGGVLLHIEEGELAWGGAVTPAGRTLRLVPRPDGTAEVTFADGRAFHDLDLRTGGWTARHPCVDDLYEGEFTVVSPNEWRVSWRVGGPAKDQLLRSVYRRRGPDGHGRP
ncbi:DUF6314 family protein [Streptomyces varsoviensis]|uniref:DUF6314 family protein n=1 Tax=Streptomyces varsoviensis TaxID=67373 RepID=UPI0033DA2880